MRLPTSVTNRRVLLGATCGAAAGMMLYIETVRGFRVTGPGVMSEDFLSHYWHIVLWSNFTFVAGMMAAGAVIGTLTTLGWMLLRQAVGRSTPPAWWSIAPLSFGAVIAFVLFRLTYALSTRPSSVVSLWQYSNDRLRPFARLAEWPWVPVINDYAPLVIVTSLAVLAGAVLVRRRETRRQWTTWAFPAMLLSVIAWHGIAGMVDRPAVEQAAESDLPNILIIGADSQRADRFGYLGYTGAPTSPFIDQLAEHSVVLEKCFVPQARTRTSMVSLWTSTYPHHHGVRESWRDGGALHPGVGNYVDVFNKAGYYTTMVGDWCGTDLDDHGFQWQQIDLPGESWNVKTLIRKSTPGTAMMLSLLLPEPIFSEAYHLPACNAGMDTRPLMLRRMQREINAAKANGKPFVMFAFGGSTHGPVAPEGSYLREFARQKLGKDADWVSSFGARSIDEAIEVVSDKGSADRKALLDVSYDAAIRTYDDFVRDTLAMLEKSGQRDNTIVVVMTDHGTSLFDHQTFGPGNWLGHDVENHIPMLIHDARPSRRVAARVPDLTSNIDLLPTLAGMVGLEAGWPIDGMDIAPLWQRPGDPLVQRRSAVFMETGVWIGKPPAWKGESKEKAYPLPNILEMAYIPSWDIGTIALRPEYRKIALQIRHRSIRTIDHRLVMVPDPDGSVDYLLFDLNDTTFEPTQARQHPAFPALRDRLLTWVNDDPFILVRDDRLEWREARSNEFTDAVRVAAQR